jgi:hypothetical protein
VIATEQVRSFLGRSLPSRRTDVTPMFVFDAGYDPLKAQRGLEGSACQILVRARSSSVPDPRPLARRGRRFYGDPSLSGPPEHIGRPRRHGPKMKCSDPSTWPEPSAEHRCEDAGYGAVRVRRVRAWAGLHPKVQNHEGRGSRGPLPIVVGTLVLVEVSRGCREASVGVSRGFCGCGGTGRRGRRQRIRISSGAPTSGASTWSTPSASSSRAWDGPPLGFSSPRAGRPMELAGRGRLHAAQAGAACPRCGPEAAVGAPLR